MPAPLSPAYAPRTAPLPITSPDAERAVLRVDGRLYEDWQTVWVQTRWLHGAHRDATQTPLMSSFPQLDGHSVATYALVAISGDKRATRNKSKGR
jgi:hypothetical protein